ncbi:MAG: hypothetical protein V2I35_12535 [Desulfocapsaceae bacterium]|jgi:ribosomal protein S12 methylthiotransferase accessory factor|nr:hypothetical protein [Desulfocapsaceae bacterium]
MDILAFCRKRAISTDGIVISQDVEWNRDHQDNSTVMLKIELPPHFPAKYDSVLERAANKCLVAHLARGLVESSFLTRISRAEKQ